MKTNYKFWLSGLVVILLAGVSAPQHVNAQPGVNITFQTFYDDLSPYGRWSRNPQYGSVWIPAVDPGFQPYSTNGYWEVTEFGNTWVSDYDWGWAPFHYGRWSYDDYSGWFWIPGYEWGPAWVNWRSGGDYYGWAPLGPGMNINVSINLPSFWWVFVPQRYITSPRWYDYCAPRRRVTHIYNRTTIINNYYSHNNRTYVYGPRRDEMERVTRRDIPVRQIDASRRGRVIVDRSERNSVERRDNTRYRADNNRSGRYEAPDRSNRQLEQPNERRADDVYSAPAERSRERANSRSRVYDNNGANGSGNNDRSRTAPESRREIPARDANTERHERPSPAPAPEIRREMPARDNNADQRGRSRGGDDNGSYRSGRSSEPSTRSSVEPRSQPRSEGRSTQGNSDSGNRTAAPERRSSRSPR